VPLLRDVMAAILVRFEWHGDGPGSGTGSPSYTLHPSPPNDRSVQQGLKMELIALTPFGIILTTPLRLCPYS
jgi:hypothetical protein